MKKTSVSLKPKRFNPDHVIGCFFLFLFIIFGLFTIYWRPFVDEADNLVTGWLISQGDLLYRDIFSHHFPLTYYWVAIIIALFGKSIYIARLSILLFQTFLFGLAMHYYRKWVPIGLTALCWGIFRLFYRGNVVLYSSISGAALFAIFIITYSVVRQGRFSKSAIFTIAVLSGIAFLSDPLSIYPIAIAYIFLLLGHSKKCLTSGIIVSSIIGLYFFYLLVSGTFTDFWQDAIFFNQEIYNKYTPSNAIRVGAFLESIIKGLHVLDPVWLNIDPFYTISLQSTKFDTWFFTGFFYRAIIIIASIALAIKKEFRTAIFVYLFCAATITISPWEFRAQAFILICLFITTSFCLGEIIPGFSTKVAAGSYWVLRIVSATILMWVIIRSTDFLYQNRAQFSYNNTFQQYQVTSDKIHQLNCNSPDTYLVHYPGGIYYYWFSGLKPVSKYAYMWPWVAESGLPSVIEVLNQPGIKVIVVREDSVIWGIYDTKNYLAPLDDYLVKNYLSLGNGIYLSPKLTEICKSIP